MGMVAIRLAALFIIVLSAALPLPKKPDAIERGAKAEGKNPALNAASILCLLQEFAAIVTVKLLY